MNQEEKDRGKLRKRFPTMHARVAADKAVDRLPVDAPMTVYVDTWILEYRRAGGRETKWED